MLYCGILLFFVLEYVQLGHYVPVLYTLHVNSIVPLSVFVGSLVSRGQVKISEVLNSTNARWLMYLMVLIVISALWCDVKQYALNTFVVVLGYCLAYFFLRKEIYSLDRLRGVLLTLVGAHVVVGILNPDLFAGDGARHYVVAGYFLGDGNDFALSVSVAIPLCLFFMLNAQGKLGKLFFAGCLAILIFLIVATQSRGAIIALASMGCYVWLKSDRKIMGIAGILAVILMIFLVAPEQFFDRMATMTKTGEEMEGSAQGRIMAWKAALQMAGGNPLLGVGVGHFAIAFGTKFRPVEAGPMPWLTAHSSYFLLLGELGIPGIVFILGIIFSNLIAGERMLREMRQGGAQRAPSCANLMIALNASLIGFAVGAAFLSVAYYPHIYILAALLECGRNISQKTILSGAVLSEFGENVSSVSPVVMESRPWSKA
jgi:putative inorganic carbon (HCO3(-)) transporter